MALNVEKFLEDELSGRITPEEAEAAKFLRSQGRLPPPKGSQIPPVQTPEMDKIPERARLGAEIVGGVLGAFAPETRLVGPMVRGATSLAEKIGARTLAPKIGTGITAGIGSGTGAAAGSLGSETFDPSKDPLKRAGINFALSAITELGGRMIFPAAPFNGRLSDAAEEAVPILNAEGATVPPGMATDNFVIDFLQNISEGSILGGGTIALTKENTKKIAQNLANRFADRFLSRASADNVDELITHIVDEKGIEAFKQAGARLYRALDIGILRSAKKQGLRDFETSRMVDYGRVKRAAQAYLDKHKAGVDYKGLERFIKDNILSKPDFVSFQEAHILRSDLMAVGRTATERTNKIVNGSKFLSRVVDSEMTNAARRIGGDVYPLWRAANDFWRQGSEQFNSRLIKQIIKSDPDKVFQTAIKNKSPQRVAEFKDFIFKRLPYQEAQDAWSGVQGRFIMDGLEKATMPGTNELNGKALLRYLEKTVGDKTAREVLGPLNYYELKQIAKTIAFTQAKTSEASQGKVFIQLSQAGALMDIVSGAEVLGKKAQLTILGAPPVLAALFSNKAFSKWFSIGVKPNIGLQVARRALSQMAAAAIKEGATVLPVGPLSVQQRPIQ